MTENISLWLRTYRYAIIVMAGVTLLLASSFLFLSRDIAPQIHGSQGPNSNVNGQGRVVANAFTPTPFLPTPISQPTPVSTRGPQPTLIPGRPPIPTSGNPPPISTPGNPPPTSTTPTPSPTIQPQSCPPTVSEGSTGGWVNVLQEDLNSSGGAGLTVDGIFGPQTKAAVENWQSEKGLIVDGIVGPQTWASLGEC